MPRRTHPALWVPTLYFAEGLPFSAVNLLALTFYQRMGMSHGTTTLVISLLAWPWTLKPLFSPWLEMCWTKKAFVIVTEFLGGASLVMLAVSLAMPNYFGYSVALLSMLGFCSAIHDVAADGLYLVCLTAKEQAEYTGWQGGSYSVAQFLSLGVLVSMAGYLQDHFVRANVSTPMVSAWMVIFVALGCLLIGLGTYHACRLPAGDAKRSAKGLPAIAVTFQDVVVSFFQKRNIWLLLVFVLLCRAGEGQMVRVAPLFLQAPRSAGGLGLTLKEFGTIYGTFGTGAFVLGNVLGGYFAAGRGLKRSLPWLLGMLSLPMLNFWYLSLALPTSNIPIALAVSVEMFGYGFGSVGVILLMMQEIAPGKYPTAHYAFANSLMSLGLVLPGAASGWLQTKLGYPRFFVWVVIAAVPAMALSRLMPVRGIARSARANHAGSVPR